MNLESSGAPVVARPEGAASGTVRAATASDIPEIAALRVDFIGQVKSISEKEKQALLDDQVSMFRSGLEKGSMLVWVYQIGGHTVGTSALLFRDQGAQSACARPESAELMAVYTRPAYRKRGIATILVRKALDHARRIGLSSVFLQPTEESYPLYKKLGFTDRRREMVFDLQS